MIQPIDADEVFIETYLKYEGRDEAAAVIAYRRAGYREPEYPVTVASQRVLKRLEPEIAKRRDVLKIATVLADDRSRESMLADLDEVFQSALDDKDHSAAVNTKRLQAQILGYLEEKTTITHKMDIMQLSDQQLEKIAMRAGGKIIDAVAVEIKPRGIGHLKDAE